MKMVSILISVLGMLLAASSRGQATILCEPCQTDYEELRTAAMEKVLASIGCDSLDCGKTAIKLIMIIINIIIVWLSGQFL